MLSMLTLACLLQINIYSFGSCCTTITDIIFYLKKDTDPDNKWKICVNANGMSIFKTSSLLLGHCRFKSNS